MGNIYLIKKIDFDNWENHFSNAIIEKIIGYTKELQQAENKVEKLTDKNNEYTGWDKETYPKYKIICVKEIE